MKLWKSIVTLMLLACWLPTTAHCGLVAAGILKPADKCCQEDKAPKSKSDGCDSSCDLAFKAALKAQCFKAPAFTPSSLVFTLASLELVSPPLNLQTAARPFDPPPIPDFFVTSSLRARAP